MNILYIAYSCNPYEGSEDQIGWSIPAESAKSNHVYVITKEEQRPFVEQYLRENPQKNLRFYYVDIPGFYKKIFRGPLYSGRLNIWHRRAMPVAKTICREQNVSVIHQITPVEFRAIGNYDSIGGIRFVCGPLGGGEFVPEGLRAYVKGHRTLERIRTLTNAWKKIYLRVTGRLKSCDCILFANDETRSFLMPDADDTQCRTVSEIGISCMPEISKKDESRKSGGKRVFLVAGRLIYRKGHDFLLDALERIPDNLDYECRILGTGPEGEGLHQKCAQSEALAKHVVFLGSVPHGRMQEEYANADVLVMPSLRETTGSVLLEAMSCGLPVVTINRFGGRIILNDHTGWMYDGDSQDAFAEQLKDCLIDSIIHRDEVIRRGVNARRRAAEFTWEKKMQYYQLIYEDLNKQA